MAPSVSGDNWLALDASLRVGIQRTLRIPDDGGDYPLPPSLGRLPIRPAAQYPDLAAPDWREGLHFLVPIHAQDAAWLQFNARRTDPHAVMIGAGGVNALTGHPWTPSLQASPQNYIVVPDQPWLDGFKVASGVVRQFVAVPLDRGVSVEHQLTGKEEGGITLASFAPKPGASMERTAPPPTTGKTRQLGVGAGGRITQRVYPDPYGSDMWTSTPEAVVHVHLIDADEFSRLTGEAVPPSPIDADTYARHGLPWFEVYDSARGELPATPELSTIKSVDALSQPPGETSKPKAIKVRPESVHPIPPRSGRKR